MDPSHTDDGSSLTLSVLLGAPGIPGGEGISAESSGTPGIEGGEGGEGGEGARSCILGIEGGEGGEGARAGEMATLSPEDPGVMVTHPMQAHTHMHGDGEQTHCTGTARHAVRPKRAMHPIGPLGLHRYIGTVLACDLDPALPPVSHHPQSGDALLFHSEKRHNVTPVGDGGRSSLVIELWAAPANTIDRYG